MRFQFSSPCDLTFPTKKFGSFGLTTHGRSGTGKGGCWRGVGLQYYSIGILFHWFMKPVLEVVLLPSR